MKKLRRLISLALAVIMIASATSLSSQATIFSKAKTEQQVQAQLEQIYKDYDFLIGWGLYDISGSSLKEVGSHNADTTFQSNCTIKAAMLLCICKMIDAGKLSLNTKLSVDKSKMHYGGLESGQYSVRYLLRNLIRVSNSGCFEVFLRYVTLEGFNSFLKSIGSGTRLTSYSFMGNCTPKNRAIEWFEIYKYCHSGAKTASFAWRQLTNAKYSAIRDGLHRPVAHKSGWYNKEGSRGCYADCAVVKTMNGGCYLVVIFTRNNAYGDKNESLVQKLAVTLNDKWNCYYNSLDTKTYAKF